MLWPKLGCLILGTYLIIGFFTLAVIFLYLSLLRGFRLPSFCKLHLRSSAMLCNVDLHIVTDVSGQSVGPIFKRWDRIEDFLLVFYGN